MNMKKMLLSGVCAGICALGADAATIVDGDTVTLEGYLVRRVRANTYVEMIGTGPDTFVDSNGQTRSNINKNNTPSSGTYANTQCLILLEDGATLRIKSGTGNCVWPALVVTNGCHAYLDVDSDVTPSLSRMVLTLGTGTLTVKNTKSLVFGNSIYKQSFDVRNVRFEDDSVNGFCFDRARIVSFPNGWENWNGSLCYDTSDDAADCYLMAENMFDGWATPPKKFPTYGMRVVNPEALGPSFTVPASYNFKLTSYCYLKASERTLANYMKLFAQGNGYFDDLKIPARTDATYTNQIVLAKAKSTLTLGTPTAGFPDVTYAGTLSGGGTLAMSAPADKATPPTATFAGEASAFTGTVTAKSSSTASLDAGVVGLKFILATNFVSAASIQSEANAEIAFAVDSTPPCLGDGTFSADAGVTVTPAALSGLVNVQGEGTFALPALGTAGAMVNDKGTATVTYGGESLPGETLKAVSADGSQTVYGAPTGSVFDVAAFEAKIPFAHFSVTVPDGGTVSQTSADARLIVGEGERATVVADGDVTASLAGTGTFALAEPAFKPTDLTNCAAFWFDFSVNDDLLAVGTARPDLSPQWTSPYERCLDKRGGEDEFRYTLWNRRSYDSATSKINVGSMVCPVWETDKALAQGQLHLFTFQSGHRLPLSDLRASDGSPHSPGYSARVGVRSSLLVMVFSANTSLHGGAAIVGTLEGTFGRGSDTVNPTATTPITTNENAKIWFDGALVDEPTNTPPGTAWRIVSIDMMGSSFSGIGFNVEHTYSPYIRGGQKYAEVIVFTNAMTAAEFTATRLETESYLAKKWGFAGYDTETALAQAATLRQSLKEIERTTVTNTVVAIGSGSVVAGTHTLRLGGSFAGTLDLQGGRLILDDGLEPYTEDQVRAIANREFWMDPDDAGTVHRYATWSSGAIEVKNITDKTVRTYNLNDRVMNGQSGRRPYLRYESRGLGPVRGWIDMNEDPSRSDTSGNCFRLRYVQSDTFDPCQDDPTSVANFGIRTAFIVLDSCRGGDNPLWDNVNGSKIQARTAGKLSCQMWPSNGTGAAPFYNGENRLSGKIVNQSEGFGGVPEVLTVRATSKLMPGVVWTMGNYNNTEKREQRYGVILGESIFYSGELTDAEVEGVEAYLMNKWIGYLPSGFTVATAATVGGTGTVEMASLATMPKIAGDFSGTVTVGAAPDPLAISVDLEAGTVSGALVNSGAAFDLPEAITVNVTCTGRARRRSVEHRYTLVDANITSATAWTWNLAGAPAKATVVKTGNRYELVIPRAGFVLYVK